MTGKFSGSGYEFCGTFRPKGEQSLAGPGSARHGRPVLVGDLILAALLSGFRTEREANAALAWLHPFDSVTIGGPVVAVEAAANYRRLRRKGVTVRKTIDMLIGTYCLMHGLELLHADRDFDLSARHLGLQTVS